MKNTGTCLVKIKFQDPIGQHHFVLPMSPDSTTNEISKAVRAEIMDRYMVLGGEEKFLCGCKGEQFVDGSYMIAEQQIEIFFCGKQLKYVDLFGAIGLSINASYCTDWCSACEMHSDPYVIYGTCYCS